MEEGELLMLIDAFMEDCVMLDRTTQPDGIGGYVTARFSCLGDWTPLVATAVSAAAMGGFIWLKEKKGFDWIENFAVACSMLLGMIAAMLVHL